MARPDDRMATFDINGFLRKTFSDFDIDATVNGDRKTTKFGHEFPDGQTDENLYFSGTGRQKRADSVPTNWRRQQKQQSQLQIQRAKIDKENFDLKNFVLHRCAYCDQEFLRRYSTNKDQRRILYCKKCLEYFSAHQPYAHDQQQHRDDDEEFYEEISQLQNSALTTSDDSTEIDNLQRQKSPKKINFDNTRRKSHQHHIRLTTPLLSDSHEPIAKTHISRKGIFPAPAPPVLLWSSDDHLQSRRSSWTSASSNRPVCRICHLHGEPGETLASPCRCAGTMQYVHSTCLVHWLEISSKKVLPTPQCELCGYHYRTHHCYKLRRMHTPSVNHQDRILHTIFACMVFIMVGCATLSIIYLRQDKAPNYRRVSLNTEDIVVITSALLFFCAFFVAVFTQYRADASLCRLGLRFWLINKHWRIKDYDKNLDYERQKPLIIEHV